MAKSRREFLTQGSLGLMGTVVVARDDLLATAQPGAQEPTPGAPPAFGTGPAVGPEVSTATFA
ncbi:MAG TPA: hypothetical protein VII37_09185, partial [Candidatus Acidoferrum sp.]